MAIFGAFTNAYLLVNSVDLTSRVKSVTLNYNAAMLDATCMGDLTKVNLAGLKEWSIQAEFVDDLAASGAGSVDATLAALVGAAAFAIHFKPVNTTIATTNPDYTGNVVLAGMPIGGAHGELLRKSVTFQCAGALDRDVTP